jgi:hypothetical protein
MKFIRPKVLGELRIQTMMAGNLAVVNGIKNSTNKIVIPCRTKEEGEEIIAQIKNANIGELLFLSSI